MKRLEGAKSLGELGDVPLMLSEVEDGYEFIVLLGE